MSQLLNEINHQLLRIELSEKIHLFELLWMAYHASRLKLDNTSSVESVFHEHPIVMMVHWIGHRNDRKLWPAMRTELSLGTQISDAETTRAWIRKLESLWLDKHARVDLFIWQFTVDLVWWNPSFIFAIVDCCRSVKTVIGERGDFLFVIVIITNKKLFSTDLALFWCNSFLSYK